MAKFLFCLPRYHTNIVPWTRILRSDGHQVAIFVSGFGPTEDHSEVVPQAIRPSRLQRFFRRQGTAGIDAFPSVRQVWSGIRREAPEVVIVRGLTRWLSRVSALCAIFQGRRLVIYDQEEASPKTFGTKARRAMLRLAGVPHFTTRMGSGKHVAWTGARTLPFGCPYASPPRPEPTSSRARVLMVAKYRDRKGHDNLLRAVSMIPALIRPSVVFCGEEATSADTEYCKSLRSLAEDLGLGGDVSFRNNVPHRHMGKLYSTHEVFILPSKHEPAAVSPVEAAWCGCTVLLSADSGTRGYFPQGKAFEFDPGAPADIARALGDVIASPSHLAACRSSCREHVALVAGDAVVLDGFLGLLPRPKA